MRLANKIALVTGSSQGIGRAIAERFAQEGADVVITYNRTPGGAEEALRNVEARGRRGLSVKADLSSPAPLRCGSSWPRRSSTLVASISS
jgi:NAD(P)-dependent dehydrogenase (short-subunit alcohol dehydrogenase family)